MTDTPKDKRTEASAVELDEKELEGVTGGRGVKDNKSLRIDDDEKDRLFKKAPSSIGGFEGDKSKL